MIVFRDGEETDLAFIMNSWLKSYYPFSQRAPEPRFYFEGHRKLLDRVYRRSRVLVACNGEDREQIFGYIVHEPKADYQVYHWLLVKFPYRGLGIAKGLLAQTREVGQPLFFTHKHKDNALGKALGAQFNPYLLYGDL